jgi:hypothetical protein
MSSTNHGDKSLVVVTNHLRPVWRAARSHAVYVSNHSIIVIGIVEIIIMIMMIVIVMMMMMMMVIMMCCVPRNAGFWVRHVGRCTA